jgi:hypothetical protein
MNKNTCYKKFHKTCFIPFLTIRIYTKCNKIAITLIGDIIMKNISLIALLLTLNLSACAQEPSAVVSAAQIAGGPSGLEAVDTITKNSVSYTGSDFFGSSCGLDLSLIEEDGSHHFLVKVNYAVHGLALPDTEASLYRFDIASNSYSDSVTGNGTVTLGAALLNNDAEADMNSLSSYEAQGLLEYSVRVETGASSAMDFEESLEEVVNDPTKLSLFAAELDVVKRIVVKIGHAGHYDASGCIDMKLTGTSQVDFEIAEHGEHDDHDEDEHEDHDEDEHDHDHD